MATEKRKLYAVAVPVMVLTDLMLLADVGIAALADDLVPADPALAGLLEKLHAMFTPHELVHLLLDVQQTLIGLTDATEKAMAGAEPDLAFDVTVKKESRKERARGTSRN